MIPLGILLGLGLWLWQHAPEFLTPWFSAATFWAVAWALGVGAVWLWRKERG